MHKLIQTFAVLFLSCMFFTACEKTDVDTGKLKDPIRIELRGAEADIVQTDQQFAFDFFGHLFNEEQGKSFMVSPLSLSMALSMTWNGAAGETKEVMKQTLSMGEYSDAEINGYYKKLKDALLKTDATTKLSIANAIFTNRFVTIKPDFLNINQQFYDAATRAVDFDSPATVGLINQWAYDNTNGLINGVIDKTYPEDLMYLLNAIYFKGIWTTKFDKKNTSKKAFLTENGTKQTVEMMHQVSEFNYMEDEVMQMVQLPYGNEAFSMMVLLPQSGKKQVDVVEALQNKTYWNNAVEKLHGSDVELYLPKFKTEYSKILNELLIDMGMGIAFNNQADFSGMSDYSAAISLVKQDTYINTDESGTEAAAVTVVGMDLNSIGVPERVVFNAEKPFIYLIRENSTGAILFMGSVVNP